MKPKTKKWLLGSLVGGLCLWLWIKQGGGSDEDWVVQQYRALVGRDPEDAQAIAYWAGQVKLSSRSAVHDQMAAGAEAVAYRASHGG